MEVTTAYMVPSYMYTHMIVQGEVMYTMMCMEISCSQNLSWVLNFSQLIKFKVFETPLEEGSDPYFK